MSRCMFLFTGMNNATAIWHNLASLLSSPSSPGCESCSQHCFQSHFQLQQVRWPRCASRVQIIFQQMLVSNLIINFHFTDRHVRFVVRNARTPCVCFCSIRSYTKRVLRAWSQNEMDFFPLSCAITCTSSLLECVFCTLTKFECAAINKLLFVRTSSLLNRIAFRMKEAIILRSHR